MALTPSKNPEKWIFLKGLKTTRVLYLLLTS